MSTCTSPSATMEKQDKLGAVGGVASGRASPGPVPSRRRHSSAHPHLRKLSFGALDPEEGLLLKVDLFLAKLEQRLDVLEQYGEENFDAGVQCAYSTLRAVRARCSHVSGEFFDVGRRRAKIMVETVESRYHDALIARETMTEKAHTGLIMLEEMLGDYETRALKLRDQGFAGAATTMIDGGRRIMDEGIAHAREVVDESFERALKAAETLEDNILHAITRAKQNGLITYHDLPTPWQINPHITRGYRFSESKVFIARSLFSVSNELVNIWSHAIGLLIVLAIAFYFYPASANFSLSTTSDKLIAAAFFFSAAKCLVCSCLWHTMNCVANKTLLERFACVDYTGISLLIAASIMTTEYTAFYCEPITRSIYLLSTASFGIAGVILPWRPEFNHKDNAWGRVAFYVSLALTGFVPAVQLSYSRGSAWAWAFYGPVTRSVLVYFCGAIVYASKIPEKWWPGAFDYIGGSHNLWHFAVLGGILFHYLAMENFFRVAFERAGSECASLL